MVCDCSHRLIFKVQSKLLYKTISIPLCQLTLQKARVEDPFTLLIKKKSLTTLDFTVSHPLSVHSVEMFMLLKSALLIDFNIITHRPINLCDFFIILVICACGGGDFETLSNAAQVPNQLHWNQKLC